MALFCSKLPVPPILLPNESKSLFKVFIEPFSTQSIISLASASPHPANSYYGTPASGPFHLRFTLPGTTFPQGWPGSFAFIFQVHIYSNSTFSVSPSLMFLFTLLTLTQRFSTQFIF